MSKPNTLPQPGGSAFEPSNNPFMPFGEPDTMGFEVTPLHATGGDGVALEGLQVTSEAVSAPYRSSSVVVGTCITHCTQDGCEKDS